jgi:enamine deaminase RidA (YjgF/YER057c/UK114 family)
VTASRRLAELGISLPQVTAPLGSYVPARRAGHLLHLSGHLAKRDGAVVTGRVGAEIDVETAARGLARQVALDLVATAAAAAGGVDALAGVIKLVGFVRSAPGFDGASDLLVEIAGEAGRHARSAIGVSELPMGAAIEIEAIFELG